MVSWVANSGPAGTLRFGFTQGGNVIGVGDSWYAQITGAQPNAPVSVTAKLNGVSNTSAMGTTDASGTFTASGVADSGSMGNWSQTWAVNGVIVGTFNFVVGAAGMHGLRGFVPVTPGMHGLRRTGGWAV